MGTSSKSPGSKDKSPLVPPHADTESGKPIPQPIPYRYKAFRTNMTRYAKTGDKKYLRTALKNYAAKSVGGSKTGVRRLGASMSSGTALINALSNIQTEDIQNDAFADIIGKPVEEATDSLADILAPDNPDSDKIRDAIKQALSKNLENSEESFDVSIINEDICVNILIDYLTEIISAEIMFETRADINISKENELRGMAHSAIDKHLKDKLNGRQISELSVRDLKKLQNDSIIEVYSEWEGFEN